MREARTSGAAGLGGVADERNDRLAAREYAADDLAADPAAGEVGLGEWAERWYATTAHLKPSTRRDYRMLLDHQVLPGRFRQSSTSGQPSQHGPADDRLRKAAGG